MAMELLCCEGFLDRDVTSTPDPVLMDDERVLQNLLSTEEMYLPMPTPSCMSAEVTPAVRKIVTDWMREVCEEQRCHPAVFPLSVNYFDRFVGCGVRVGKGHLQLLAAACLLLSSKLRQARPLSSRVLVLYTDSSITLQELWQWELVVVSRLQWDLAAITPLDFVDLLLGRLQNALTKRNSHAKSVKARETDAQLEEDVKQRCHGLIFQCVTDSQFALYPPSMVACSCLVAAYKDVVNSAKFSHVEILNQLHLITQIELDLLRNCLEQVDTLTRPALRLPSPVPPMITPSDTPTCVQDIEFWKS